MRCFVAAWPDAATGLALAALADGVRHRVDHRRATRVDDLHLTLAFVGDLDDDKAFAVSNQIAALSFEPFTWQIDTLGFFVGAGVVWAGADSQRSKPLIELARRVREALDRSEVVYDGRPLAPHVTLLRGVSSFEMQRIAPHIVPIKWRIDSIALYHSTPRSAPAGRVSRYSRVTR